MKSKTISRYISKHADKFSSYHTEICDGKTQHWVSAKEGFWFPLQETKTVNGFLVSELMRDLKSIAPNPYST